MDAWQKLRLERAKEQDIYVTSVDCTPDGWIFSVQGVSDSYLVEVDENVGSWPPRCNCDDSHWRPDVLCKHILLCLSLMGFDEQCLGDCSWDGPDQENLYEYLSNAPSCVGCTVTVHDTDKEKQYR